MLPCTLMCSASALKMSVALQAARLIWYRREPLMLLRIGRLYCVGATGLASCRLLRLHAVRLLLRWMSQGCTLNPACRVAAGTFPGTFYHASLFFSTKELNLGFAAVTTATAISQARLGLTQPEPHAPVGELMRAHACQPEDF